MEGIADGGDRVADGDGSEAAAAREGIVADGGDGVGDGHGSEASRSIKSRIFDFCHTTWNYQICYERAVDIKVMCII